MSKAILRYKALRPEELEHYNHIANENKVANAAALRAWIESHSPEEIRKANKARVHLKRLGVKGFRNKLQDGRQVKRSIGCYGIFVKERFGSGDFMHIKFPDATKLIAAEWKTLSDAEKERYHAIAKLDRTRYTQEKKTVYNLDTKSSIAPQAAAAV
ncbi:hypothetical protein MMC06_006035 [Schaereria dolodes]|nr:hypothetical protein [Schaereria dolodes]